MTSGLMNNCTIIMQQKYLLILLVKNYNMDIHLHTFGVITFSFIKIFSYFLERL